MFREARKIGRPGTIKEFKPESMKPNYRVFEVSITYGAQYSAYCQLAGLNDGAFQLLNPVGGFPDNRNFPAGTFYWQPVGAYSISGEAVSSSNQTRANIREILADSGGGSIDTNRALISAQSSYVPPASGCENAEPVGISIAAGLLFFGYENGNTWDLQLYADFDKTGAAGSLCSGAGKIEGLFYVKPDFLNTLDENPERSAEVDISITEL